MKTVIALIACACSSAAFAAPPPAPEITVAATDIRQLEFNWDPVPGVQTYELWFQAGPGASWVKYQERSARRAPLFRIGVAVHLLDWRTARYHVKACNYGGCSTSNEVGVDGQQLAAMGYFKPPTSGERKEYGTHVALSADGRTMAVSSRETVGENDGVAGVHVYRKTTSASGWRREATLLLNIDEPSTLGSISSDALALSGDGDLLAIGTSGEDVGGVWDSGAVYLFRRSGTTWNRAQKLTGTGIEDDRFGFLVKLDDAGQTLVISHQSAAVAYEPGKLEVYRNINGRFVHDATLPSTRENGSQGWCEGIAISGDGQTLARSCLDGAQGYVQVMNAPDWIVSARVFSGSGDGVDVSYDGTQLLVQQGVGANAFRLENGAWVHDGELPNTPAVPYFQQRHIALSRDGKVAALGNFMDNTLGRGPVYPPYVADPTRDQGSGGVMVYVRRPTGWEIRRFVNPDSRNEAWAGHTVALGNNGNILAVGAPFDSSAARGIDGNRDDSSAVFRGAVWLY